MGIARTWEFFDSGSSSSSTSNEFFKEVELGFIVRRVQGETFLVKDFDPSAGSGKQEKFRSQIFQAFQKHMDRKGPKAPVDPSTVGFAKVPVLADGLCFWHSLLRVSLPEEFGGFERSESGGPTDPERLAYEIDFAKIAAEEFVALYQKVPNFDENIINSLLVSSQVELDHVHTVCKTSGLALRITISEEVRLGETIVHVCFGLL